MYNILLPGSSYDLLRDVAECFKGITNGLKESYDVLLEQARMDLATVFSQLEMSVEVGHENIPMSEVGERFIARKMEDGRRYFEIKRDEVAAAAKCDEEAVADEHVDQEGVDDEQVADEHAEDVAAHEPVKEVAAPKTKTRGRLAQLEKLVAATETQVNELSEKLKANEEKIFEVENKHDEKVNTKISECASLNELLEKYRNHIEP